MKALTYLALMAALGLTAFVGSLGIILYAFYSFYAGVYHIIVGLFS